MFGFSLLSIFYLNKNRKEIIEEFEELEEKIGGYFEDLDLKVENNSSVAKLLMNNNTLFFLQRIIYALLIVFVTNGLA